MAAYLSITAKIILGLMFVTRAARFLDLAFCKDPSASYRRTFEKTSHLYQNTGSSRFTSFFIAMIWLSAVWYLIR